MEIYNVTRKLESSLPQQTTYYPMCASHAFYSRVHSGFVVFCYTFIGSEYSNLEVRDTSIIQKLNAKIYAQNHANSLLQVIPYYTHVNYTGMIGHKNMTSGIIKISAYLILLELIS
jgi:hypothetical protein